MDRNSTPTEDEQFHIYKAVAERMETKKVVFDRFKNEIMDRLELCGHQAHYYHTNENYRDLLLIQNSSFEEYLAAHE